MFIDVLEMLFNCFESVFSSLDVPLFTYKGVEISFLYFLLAFLFLSMFFTFALVPRAGSGLGGVGNVLTFMRDDFNRENAEERRKQNEIKRQADSFARAQARAAEQSKRAQARAAEQEKRNSYEAYAERRKRNTEYFNRYNKENGIKYKKGDK